MEVVIRVEAGSFAEAGVHCGIELGDRDETSLMNVVEALELMCKEGFLRSVPSRRSSSSKERLWSVAEEIQVEAIVHARWSTGFGGKRDGKFEEMGARENDG
ncbi:uncharacterized protein A4U43_C04F24470 [Asparagus officinalis]|uniref:Uncharacterized protein n=1 Tax=Asparagus officinalis TaxID=4686 RepID=A0A5P1F3E8_ASPOF|nr:uncharacterized protein A4U43_C04F24470 [Asparagus officinalis]